jgi:hypothetical protein
MPGFDTHPEFQRVPDVAGFEAYDVDLVSPELPCGSSWLANCLLELGVSLWKPWNVRDEGAWQALGGRQFRYIARDEPLRALLPSLRCGRTFEFRAAPVPRVYHYWPGFYPAVRKVILVVRDPRDALHSAWRRARAQQRTAVDFERFAATRYFHYPLSFAEYLLVFLRLWRMALKDKDHLIVRYEDYRLDAAVTLGRVCAFLGLDVEMTALRRALTMSSLEASQQAERGTRVHSVSPVIQNRAGVAYEFRNTFTPSMHAALGDRFRDICEWLEYETAGLDAVLPISSQPLCAGQLAAAMRFDQAPVAAQTWLHAALCASTADWRGAASSR